jgi:catechol 2,3-dioxygenase-like lactoylglutathione lyase family enzyme
MMNARRILWALVAGVVAVGGPAQGAQGLGVGRGIDHVALLVRPENFDAVTSVFSRQLGFTETPTLTSAAGVENRLIWFPDLSYLEIDSFTADNPATAPFLDFLAHHEGGKFYGTEVVDANQAVSFLNAAGYPNVGPIPAGPLTLESSGETVGPIPLWNEIILTSRIAPDNSNFFLDYDEAQVQRMFHEFPSLAPHPHPNTAQKIDTVWLVVSDLDSAIAFYQGLGLKVRPKSERIAYLGAKAAVVQYHNATLTLLEPDGPGVAADFAADRGEGILGVSLDVASLDAAHSLIQRRTGLKLRIFNAEGRNRFQVPTSLTHGLLVEMVEE